MSPPSVPHLSRRSHFGDTCLQAQSRSLIANAHHSPLDLSLTNPGRANLPQLKLEELLEGGRPAYRAEPRGTFPARQALANAHRARAPRSADDFIVTASTSEAYAMLLQTLCDPGDAILVPSPSYPLFEQLAQLCSVQIIPYPIRYDGAWFVDTSELPSPQELKKHRIRAIFCVSPNNPTGNPLRRCEWDALSALGVPIVVDEVFRPYLNSGALHSSDRVDPFAETAPRVLTVVLDGLSKRTLAPGLKIAWLSAHGPGAQLLLSRLELVYDTFLSVSEAAQSALPTALNQESEIQEVVCNRLAQNDSVLRELTKTSPLTVLHSNGGWMRIVRFAAVRSEEDWAARWAERGLHIHPGALYDLPFNPSAVLSLLPQPEIFHEGVTRLLTLATKT